MKLVRRSAQLILAISIIEIRLRSVQVSKYLRDGGDKANVSRMLCDKAKKAGSHDNITVVVVFFKDDITLVDDDDIDLSKKPPVPKEGERLVPDIRY